MNYILDQLNQYFKVDDIENFNSLFVASYKTLADEEKVLLLSAALKKWIDPDFLGAIVECIES